MLQVIKTGCLLALILFLTGCSTVPVIESNFASQKRAVGIIALVDKHTTRHYVGRGKFNTRTDSVDLTGLDLQKTILDIAQNDLARAGISSRALENVELPPIVSAVNDDWVKQLAREHNVDFLIFITPTSSEDFVFGSSHVIRGHGIYYQTHPAMATNTVAYYSGRVLSYDVKTGIWGGQSTATAQTSASGHAHLYPAQKDVGPHHEFEQFQSLNEQELDYIRSTLQNVTSQAVRQMLSQLPINRTLSVSTR